MAGRQGGKLESECKKRSEGVTVCSRLDVRSGPRPSGGTICCSWGAEEGELGEARVVWDGQV